MSPNIPPLPNLQRAAKNETLSIVHGIYAGLLVLVQLHFISGISAIHNFHVESGYCVATFGCADCFEHSGLSQGQTGQWFRTHLVQNYGDPDAAQFSHWYSTRRNCLMEIEQRSMAAINSLLRYSMNITIGICA